MLDFEVQLIMIDRWFTQKLSLTFTDLEPYPFTIVTSIGGMEQAIKYTKKSLQSIFSTRFDPLYSHLSLKYVMTSITNYDILLCQ